LVRLFKREVKLTPAQFRRKFGQLRAVLQTARRD
jgi:AraC-like DNA-binding protein